MLAAIEATTGGKRDMVLTTVVGLLLLGGATIVTPEGELRD